MLQKRTFFIMLQKRTLLIMLQKRTLGQCRKMKYQRRMTERRHGRSD